MLGRRPVPTATVPPQGVSPDSAQVTDPAK